MARCLSTSACGGDASVLERCDLLLRDTSSSEDHHLERERVWWLRFRAHEAVSFRDTRRHHSITWSASVNWPAVDGASNSVAQRKQNGVTATWRRPRASVVSERARRCVVIVEARAVRRKGATMAARVQSQGDRSQGHKVARSLGRTVTR